jgi:hypothetical protein
MAHRVKPTTFGGRAVPTSSPCPLLASARLQALIGIPRASEGGTSQTTMRVDWLAAPRVSTTSPKGVTDAQRTMKANRSTAALNSSSVAPERFASAGA